MFTKAFWGNAGSLKGDFIKLWRIENMNPPKFGQRRAPEGGSSMNKRQLYKLSSRLLPKTHFFSGVFLFWVSVSSSLLNTGKIPL